ncbi:MAG: YbjN domain-containing protein [Acidimicrobiales bacterium]
MPLVPPASSAELDAIEARIDAWLRKELDENPVMVAVDRGEPGERRWYVRLEGEEKDFTTLWFRLAQRSLHVETYVMPAPEENEADFYSHLLRRNLTMHGLSFAIGDENAVYLVGRLPLESFDVQQLDQLIGSAYQYVEQFFRPALRIGFASRFSAR